MLMLLPLVNEETMSFSWSCSVRVTVAGWDCVVLVAVTVLPVSLELSSLAGVVAVGGAVLVLTVLAMIAELLMVDVL